MGPNHSILSTIIVLVVIVTLSMATSAAAYFGEKFISYTDPGNTDPGNTGAPNSPWSDLVGLPCMTPGQTIWFAMGHGYGATNTTYWWVEVVVPAGGATFQASGWTAYYYGGASQSATTLVSSSVVPGPPFKQRWNFQTIPEPDWELLKITRTADGGMTCVAVEISGSSFCSRTEAVSVGQVVTLSDMNYGVPGAAVQLTKFVAYHNTSPVDTSVPPTISASPESGNWSHQFIYEDEAGDSLPHGAICLTTPGPGVSGGDKFDVSFAIAGPVPGLIIFAAYNAATDETNTVIIPVSGDIPTLTEWGMIIFCGLLFAWMAWMVVRRRKTPEVGI